MGKLDIRSREYTRQNEIFADLCNYLIYEGEQVIHPEDLHEKDATELIMPYGEGGKSVPVQKFRDVLKHAEIKETNTTIYAVIGVENQSEVHYAMVVRNMLYDAIDYASQVSEIAKVNKGNSVKKTSAEFLSGLMKNDKIKPVITIVVYWGADEWDGARTLHDILDVEGRILKYVPDYFLNLLVPAEVDDFDKFSTNLGLVMQCVKYSKDKKTFKDMFESNKERFLRISRNAAELILEITNVKMDIDNQKGEEVDMCEAIEGIMEDCKELGKELGKEIGRIGLIRSNKDEMSVPAIASFMKTDEDYVKNIISLIEEFPDEDDTKIAERIVES